MRVFVAGGAGYIGSACTEYLLDRGYEVTVFDDLITGHIEAVDPRAKFIKANLADRENLKKVVKEGNYDAIMHFAAFSLVGESMKNPSKYFNNNLANAINLADAAVEGGVKTFVFSSTAATFGEPKEIPIKEDAPQLPINPYGESKLCTEKSMDRAIDMILEEFNTWQGCEMHSIRFAGDECYSEENLKWLNSLDSEHEFTECSEFISEFHSPLEQIGAWEPDTEYTGWQWWLGAEADGDWELVTWGY